MMSQRYFTRFPFLFGFLVLGSVESFTLPSAAGCSTSVAVKAEAYNPSSLLYAEHEKLLVSRGELEAQLMTSPTPLQANIVKGSGGGGGFGGGSKKSLLQDQAKSHAKVLQEQGVVRIDSVLSGERADALRERVYALRKESEALVQEGQLMQKDRFADVLLTHNRRDMTLPIGPEWAADTLANILLESPVGKTLEILLGKKALLREWSCLMSDPGSQRQVAHPDTPWQQEPVLYTCFVALQDITPNMGPTTWLPQTHTQEMHQRFQDESMMTGKDQSPKDQLLATQPSVLGTLPKGACAIFDSRLLHCGGANQSETSRALMYCSFQNPKVTPGNPGSIRSDLIGKWTLQTLRDELELFRKNKPCQVLQLKS